MDTINRLSRMTESDDRKSQQPTQPAARDVAVLGCGNMGSAMARALLAAGRRVVVWNRTTERAEALSPDGAVVRTSADEALTETPLAILCLRSTDDVRNVLTSVAPERLTGHTILNVTSGTPHDAHTMRDWAQQHGVDYLDAAIGAYPEQMGTEDARITVAGDEGHWIAHQDAICDLAGSSMYVGSDHSAANAIDAALTGAFYISSLVSFIEAARFMKKFGVPHDILSNLSAYSVAVLDDQLKQVLDRIAAGDFATDQASLNVYADAAATFAASLNDHGDAPMIRSTATVLREAVEAGLGDEDIAAVATLGS